MRQLVRQCLGLLAGGVAGFLSPPLALEFGASGEPDPPGAPVNGGVTRMPAISTLDTGTVNVTYLAPGVLTAAVLIGRVAKG